MTYFLHYVEQRTVEPKNVEYRMSKGGFALLSLFYKIGRIPSFDIRRSLFDIRYSLFQSFSFDQTGLFLYNRQNSFNLQSSFFILQFYWRHRLDKRLQPRLHLGIRIHPRVVLIGFDNNARLAGQFSQITL